MIGAAEPWLWLLAFRYAGIGRTVIALLAGALGIVAAPRLWPAVAVVGAVLCWSAGYTWLLARGRQPGWLVPVDVVVVATACLTQRWTVSSEALATNQGWVLVLASITVVACQWHTSVPLGVWVVVVVDAAFLGGVLLAAPPPLGGPLEMAVWLPVEAVLGRLLWLLVRRGGRRADELSARECIRFGAFTYRTKAEGDQHLVPAILAAANNVPYTPPALSGAFYADFYADAGHDRPALSNAERETLRA